MRLQKLLVILFLLSASGAYAADTKSVTFTVDKFDRTYVYHVPHYDRGQKLPLVLVLPDAGDDGDTALKRYKWIELADKEGFIVAGLNPLPVDPKRAPVFQTNPTYWSDGSGRGNGKRGDLDDSSYARAVIADLSDSLPVDPKRIYATGFSNGASMTHLLGITLSDKLAAIAPVEGYLWLAAADPLKPLPVLMIQGDDDPVDPLKGGMGINPWTQGPEKKPPVIDSAKAWAAAMKCTVEPASLLTVGNLPMMEWQNCAHDTLVDYVIIPGEGHHWPGGESDLMPQNLTGPDDKTLDATPYIWNFFKAHPRS